MLKPNQVTTFCGYPFKRFKVTCEGDVTMCCFQQRKCLGNILEHSFDDIWFSEKVQRIRKEIIEGTMPVECQTTSCPFNQRSARVEKELTYKRYPSEMEIDLPTQHCNIGGLKPTKKNPACIMCERHLRGWEDYWQDDKLEEICEKLKPYAKHLRWLHIQGVSEPFWKERIFEILEWLDVDSYKNQIQISTTTNGTLMNEARRTRFLKYPKSCITWSLDAATAETFQKIRRLKTFDRIIENLWEYRLAAEDKGVLYGAPNQYVQIHNNINTINLGEVEQMVEMAARLKVHRIDFNPTYGVPEICVNRERADMFEEAQVKIINAAKRFGMFVTFMRDFPLDYNGEWWMKHGLVRKHLPDSGIIYVGEDESIL